MELLFPTALPWGFQSRNNERCNTPKQGGTTVSTKDLVSFATLVVAVVIGTYLASWLQTQFPTAASAK